MGLLALRELMYPHLPCICWLPLAPSSASLALCKAGTSKP